MRGHVSRTRGQSLIELVSVFAVLLPGVVMDPDATIKEPLPKGFRKDKDGGILDANNVKVAQINEDGTVTVKVGKDYLTQGPAGVREESGVIESKQGKGITGRIKAGN